MLMMLSHLLNMLKYKFKTNGLLLLDAKMDKFPQILKHVIKMLTKLMPMTPFLLHNMLN